jgi:Na+-transporting NADH:ubiquinone oxidoreductase subunit NqrB
LRPLLAWFVSLCLTPCVPSAALQIPHFLRWVLTATWHSLVLYFAVHLIFTPTDVISDDGTNAGLWVMGNMCAIGT